ncbi:MAG: TolC family protein [Bacteroidota bacterium]
MKLLNITNKTVAFLAGMSLLLSSQAAAQQRIITLQDAISLALEHNRTLKVSGLEVSRSQQQIRVAKSKMLPKINLNGQYSHYFSRPVFFGFGGNDTSGSDELSYARFGGEDQFAATLSLFQPLYDPAFKPEWDLANLQNNASKFALRNDESEVVANVRQSYLRVLVLRERLQLQQESLNRNKKVLADSRSLYAQGRALRVDTLRAYTTVKNLQPDILKFSNAEAIAREELVHLLGLENNEELLLTDSLFIQTIDRIPSEEEVLEEAKRSRADLQKLAIDERVAAKTVSFYSAGRLPSVSLAGQYQLLTQANSFNVGDANWPSVSYAGIQVSVPLFNGNLHVAKVKEARLSQQQASMQLIDAQEQLKVDVHQVVAYLHETTESLLTQSTVKETALLSYDIVQYRYEKGVASRLELTDAELALTTANTNYLEAVYEYLSAHNQLDRVVGRVK